MAAIRTSVGRVHFLLNQLRKFGVRLLIVQAASACEASVREHALRLADDGAHVVGLALETLITVTAWQ